MGHSHRRFLTLLFLSTGVLGIGGFSYGVDHFFMALWLCVEPQHYHLERGLVGIVCGGGCVLFSMLRIRHHFTAHKPAPTPPNGGDPSLAPPTTTNRSDRILMRGPIFFVCVGGNIVVFRDEAHAAIAAEAIDVLNGEYGEHGWDADGRLISLEARLPTPVTRMFGLPGFLHVPDGKVTVRALDAPPEPERLRSILLEFWIERDAARATSLSSGSLEELVASMQGFIGP